MAKRGSVTLQGPLYPIDDVGRKRPHYYVGRVSDTIEFRPGDVLSEQQVKDLCTREDLYVNIEPFRG